MIYIYALVDPFTKQVRYIGKSIRPKERLTNHCNDRSITWRTNWIQSVLARGKHPELLILQTLDDTEDWQLAESEWIKKAREMNWPLTNCTDGGDGLVNPPEEVRQKIITTWIGRKHSYETKKLIGQTSRGRKHSEESKENMRKIMTGRKFTPEWLAKISKGNSKLTDAQVREIKRLLSDGMTGSLIADIFDVNKSTIYNIKYERFYGHITQGGLI